MTLALGVAAAAQHADEPRSPARVPALTPAALGVSILLSGCAAVTPPPRFSPVSPADAEAPEAATPPAAPKLSREPEARTPPAPPETPPASTSGHEGHAGAESETREGHAPPPAPTAGQAEDRYVCPAHPAVAERSPGSCPRCGARLVRRPAEERRR